MPLVSFYTLSGFLIFSRAIRTTYHRDLRYEIGSSEVEVLCEVEVNGTKYSKMDQVKFAEDSL